MGMKLAPATPPNKYRVMMVSMAGIHFSVLATMAEKRDYLN